MRTVELSGKLIIGRSVRGLIRDRLAYFNDLDLAGLSDQARARLALGIWGGAGFTDALEQDVLDHVMGKATLTPNAQNFIGLSSTTPTEAAGNFTEPSTGSYARVETEGTGANGPSWDAASGTAPVVIANAEAITFPTATADWVSAANLTHFGIFAAGSGGSVQIWGALTTPKPVLNGDTASFPAGAIVVQLGDPGDSY